MGFEDGWVYPRRRHTWHGSIRSPCGVFEVDCDENAQITATTKQKQQTGNGQNRTTTLARACAFVLFCASHAGAHTGMVNAQNGSRDRNGRIDMINHADNSRTTPHHRVE